MRSATSKPQDRWHVALRYDGATAAANAYERARDFIFGADIDATVFRIVQDETMIVAVVGDRAVSEQDRQSLAERMHGGLPCDLDDDVVAQLRSRRGTVVAQGPGQTEKRRGGAEDGS